MLLYLLLNLFTTATYFDPFCGSLLCGENTTCVNESCYCDNGTFVNGQLCGNRLTIRSIKIVLFDS